ncbi:MAG: long-chain fatty acid--CoA ligase, partial [Thermodesulfobacteriota bacterium]
DPDGFLTITDRKKDLIITSVGKNVSPQGIETALRTEPDIKEALVYGNGRAHLVALIIPDPERLKETAASLGVSDKDGEELLSDPKIQKSFEEKIHAKLTDFARYEQIRRFTLIKDTLTQAGGELTPTMKVKREKVGEQFKDVIEKMYG